MDRIMRLIAPTSRIGSIIRFFVLIGVVLVADISFSHIFEMLPGGNAHSAVYHVAHATFVSGPLVIFFLAVTSYQVKLQKRLWRLSCQDGLTGLNNRRTFFELTRKSRSESPFGVLLMLDADWFKKINDSYGHNAGDRCLGAIATALRQNVRHGDIIGRIGGEEFAIYLPDASRAHANVIGDRLTGPFTFDTETYGKQSVTLSIGGVLSVPEASLDGLFAIADAALYQAKQSGRARFIIRESTVDRAHGRQFA